MPGDEGPDNPQGRQSESPPEDPTSSELLARARGGDRSAAGALFARWLPWLRQRARGRLPHWARGVVDTSDLVQEVLLRTLRRLTGFESTSSAAFREYLLRAVEHRIRDEMRRVVRRRPQHDLDGEELRATGPSPLQEAIDGEAWERYLRALGRLTERERRLIVGRAELGYSFRQLALVDQRASAEAARKALGRALVRLSQEMDA